MVDPIGSTSAPRPVRSSRFRAVAGFVLLVVAAELLVRVLAPTLGEPQIWYSRLAQDKLAALDAAASDVEPATVVFAGSSAVQAAFDPHRFTSRDRCGRVAHNAAILGATPEMTRDWLDRHVLPRTGATTVVLGVTPRDLSEGAASAEPAYFSSEAARTDLLGRLQRQAGRVSALVRYRSILRDVEVLRARLAPEGSPSGVDTRGWIPPQASPPAYAPGEYAGSTALTTGPRRSAVEALRRTILDLRTAGVRPVIAEVGFAERWDDLTPVARRTAQRTHAELEELADRLEVQRIDLRSVRDTELFLDPVHANAAGSRRMTDLLVDRLEC